jgi:Short C-terminal domain
VESRYPLPLLMWTLLFCTLALSGLYAVLGPAAGPGVPKGTAIFLAALFIPMGLAPVPVAFTGRRARAAIGGVGAAQAAALASVLQRRPRQPQPASARGNDGEDPIAKIEKLSKLRDKGVISDAEFEVQKQRLLREV